jgi:hypothetical protein
MCYASKENASPCEFTTHADDAYNPGTFTPEEQGGGSQASNDSLLDMLNDEIERVDHQSPVCGHYTSKASPAALQFNTNAAAASGGRGGGRGGSGGGGSGSGGGGGGGGSGNTWSNGHLVISPEAIRGGYHAELDESNEIIRINTVRACRPGAHRTELVAAGAGAAATVLPPYCHRTAAAAAAAASTASTPVPCDV